MGLGIKGEDRWSGHKPHEYTHEGHDARHRHVIRHDVNNGIGRNSLVMKQRIIYNCRHECRDRRLDNMSFDESRG